MQCKSRRVVTCCETLPSGRGVMSSPESTSAVVVWIKPTHDQGSQTQVQKEERPVRLYTQIKKLSAADCHMEGRVIFSRSIAADWLPILQWTVLYTYENEQH